MTIAATMVKVRFEPVGAAVEVPAGTTIAAAAELAGVALDHPCGGRGRCGKCRVNVAPEPSASGRGRSRARRVLACQERLAFNTVVTVPAEVMPGAIVGLTQARAARFKLDPPLVKKFLEPSFLRAQAGGGLWQAIQAHLAEGGPTGRGPAGGGPAGRGPTGRGPAGQAALPALRALGAAYPTWKREGVTAVISRDTLLGVEPGDTTGSLLGFAVDIGTTTVAGYLYDLCAGRRLAQGSALNRQVKYGGDVISRISAAQADGDPGKLRAEVVATVAAVIRQTCGEAGVSPDAIYEVVAVGNSTMVQLFLGIQTTSLGFSPFWVVQKDPQTVPAAGFFPELGVNPLAQVVCLPLIGGYVGADTTALILATGLAHSAKLKLAVDIGTNGEMVLGSRKGMWACSAAAGPALEGAGISHGMRALPGAIDEVRIVDGQVRVTTIGRRPPLGLCGSGVVSAVAELLRAGVIAPSGRLARPGEALADPRLESRLVCVPAEGGRDEAAFVVAGADEARERTAASRARGRGGDEPGAGAGPIYLTQSDVRAVQLAKAAIAAGIKLLCAETATRLEDVAEILLAGAFGNYIDIADAKRIGLLPDIPGVPVTPVGNAAGAGAQMALLSRRSRAEANQVPDKVTLVELSLRPDFQRVFAASIGFAPE